MKHLLVACALMILVALSAACMAAWLRMNGTVMYVTGSSYPTVQVIGPDCQCPSNMLPVLSVDNSMDKFKICVGPR